ncbi:MAG: hypothetical protein ACRCW9_06080 [Cetobacterium sp.]
MNLRQKVTLNHIKKTNFQKDFNDTERFIIELAGLKEEDVLKIEADQFKILGPNPMDINEKNVLYTKGFIKELNNLQHGTYKNEKELTEITITGEYVYKSNQCEITISIYKKG